MAYSRDPQIPGLKHLSVAYKSEATRLQTLDIWLPSTHNASRPGAWIIYVHGGAWRDPTQDSLCSVPTFRSLATHRPALLQEGHVAGIASLNYRLSPYPNHSTDPSAPDDADRNVQHPAHAQDVMNALLYLIEEYNVETWIGVGHSCGATLLLQLPLVCKDSPIQRTLQGLVLLAGIYDIPTFLFSHAPSKCPDDVAKIYADIIAGAFGRDPQVYSALSPSSFAAKELWGSYVVLGYSREDELVEPAQRGLMLERYVKEGWIRSDNDARQPDTRIVDVRDLKLGHDEVWEDGVQIADLIAEVVDKLGAR